MDPMGPFQTVQPVLERWEECEGLGGDITEKGLGNSGGWKRRGGGSRKKERRPDERDFVAGVQHSTPNSDRVEHRLGRGLL